MKLGHAYILKSKGQPYVQFWVLTYFLRYTDFCRVLRLGHFLKGLEPLNLGHAYILKSNGQPYVQSWVLTFFLRFIDLCWAFAFRSFSQKL